MAMSPAAAHGFGHTAMITLLILVLGVSTAHLAITLRTKPMPNLTCPPVIAPRSLPCQSIPLRYVEDEPICADKLLHAMNITSSHILTWDQMLRAINASGLHVVNDSQR
jgi:hypothetical protein